MESFYMFLPSNVVDLTDRNTIGNYVTHLPQTMKLHGAWEVGLAEILYTKTWYNLLENEELRLIAEKKGTSQFTCPLKAGFYPDFQDVFSQINHCLSQICMQLGPSQGYPGPIPPIVKFSNDKSRVIMIPGMWEDKKTVPLLSFSLRNILGFNPYKDNNFDEFLDIDGKFIKGAMISEKPIDIRANITSIYVYCDIVKSSVVGDSFSKLLRVVSVPDSKPGDTVQRIYENPLYFPVDKKEFQTVEIDVKDDTGETLRFDRGRIVVVLHFRKKNE